MREKLVKTSLFLFILFPAVGCFLGIAGVQPKQALIESAQFVGGMLTYLWIWEEVKK